MKQAKKWGVFLVTLLMLGIAAALIFWDTCADCVSVLATGRGVGAPYVLTAADGEGAVYALGQDKTGWTLVKGDQNGNRLQLWRLSAETLPKEGRPSLLYLASGGAVYLGLYDTQQSPVLLKVFRITEKGRNAELLLSEECEGATLQEQMQSRRLSAFTEVDSVVTFAVIQGSTAQFYRRTGAVGGLEKMTVISRDGLRQAIALADGQTLAVTDNSLIRSDKTVALIQEDASIIQVLRTGTGVYCVDGTGLAVYYADIAKWNPYVILQLTKDAYDLDNCADLQLTDSGSVLLLMKDGRLLMDSGSAVTDLTGMLYRPVWNCVLILAGLLLAVLALTAAVWYVVCEQQKLQLPLFLRWGVLLAAAALLAMAVQYRWMILPGNEADTLRQTQDVVTSVTDLTQADRTWDDAYMQDLADALANTRSGLYTDVEVTAYGQDEQGNWRIVCSNSGWRAGQRAELSPAFDRSQAELALENGTAAFEQQENSSSRCVCGWAKDGQVLMVDADMTAATRANAQASAWMVKTIGAMALLLTAIGWICLASIALRLARIIGGMKRLNRGESGVELHIPGGDELSYLGDSVTAAGTAFDNLRKNQQKLAESYRRFVPERILALLGKKSIQEVDKHTCTARNLATMMLWFAFPQEVYEKSGKELFDNINEIVERTAAIVTRNGGVVFNFAYNGYDAVFETGSKAAVSTAVAVQQEILDINREREKAGRPQVTMRIALDEGSVTIGMVGDETQIEPASISSSFVTVRHLTDLCGRMEANILCTETVIDGCRDYGNRYIGKCWESGQWIRAYEIFDADPYELRKLKEQTGGEFAEGIYAMYSLDFSKAKRIFLKLAHSSDEDGGVRYYLYLADHMEKNPGDEVSLDCGQS